MDCSKKFGVVSLTCLREVGSVSTMIYKGAVTIHPRLNFQVMKSSLSTLGFRSQLNEFSGDCLGFLWHF